MGEHLETRFLRYVRHHVLEALVALYLVPVFWGGLVPFDFGREVMSTNATDTWLALPVTERHFPDMASNVALYLPLGFLVCLWLRKRRWGGLASLAGTVLAGAALSYVVEYSQVYSLSRVSSASDFTCNVVGMLVGGALASLVRLAGAVSGERAPNLSERWRRCIRSGSAGILAGGMAAVLFLASVAPFDVTFSPNRVVQSAKEARFDLFSTEAKLSPAVQKPVAGGEARAHYRAARDRWQLRMDYLVTGAGYALLAVLLCRHLSSRCALVGMSRTVTVLSACGMLAVASCAARLFIISRTVEVTHVVVALVGALCGLALADAVIRAWAPGGSVGEAGMPAGRRRLVTRLLVGWCLLIVARQGAPFMPDFSRESTGQQIKAAEWIPLRVYERALLPVSLDDMLSKVGRYSLLGVLVCLWRWSRSVGKEASVFKTAAVVGVAVAALEGAQIVLPSRVVSLTEVLIATVGAGSGVVSFRLVRAYLASERAAAEDRVLFNVELGEGHPVPVGQSSRRTTRVGSIPGRPDRRRRWRE